MVVCSCPRKAAWNLDCVACDRLPKYCVGEYVVANGNLLLGGRSLVYLVSECPRNEGGSSSEDMYYVDTLDSLIHPGSPQAASVD